MGPWPPRAAVEQLLGSVPIVAANVARGPAAAGRRVGSPAEVRACFATALEKVKPSDALIVGMYQQLGDQVGQNAAVVRELCAKAPR